MNNLFIFCCGAAVGAFAAWAAVKKKYEVLAQEEIDSVKREFNKQRSEFNQKKQDVKTANKIIEERNYIPNNERKEDNSMDKPYIISPDEFGEFEEYEQISLTYYSNDILADEFDEPIHNIDEIVGVDSLKHFGEYEDDSVFVRNDRLKCDYEILLDNRKYKEAVKH